MRARTLLALSTVVAAALAAAPGGARAQQIDLSHGGPITVTALDGIEWHQNEQTIIANGDAKAVRDTVTVTADTLIAHYRRKACTPAPGTAQAAPGNPVTRASAPGPAPVASPTAAAPSGAAPATASGATPGAPPPPCPPATPAAQPAGTAPKPPALDDSDTGNNEIYRLEAIGHVHIYTATDNAWGDHAVYDIDKAVLVLTGAHLKLITPQDTLTARDSMEYWSQLHMAVGRGDAVVVTNDGRRLAGDVLVGYTTPDQPATQGKPAAPPPRPAKSGATPDPLANSGKLQKVDAFGHVDVRTATETVLGDRGVYVPDTGIARVVGNVRITRGPNQLNGNQAVVDMHTGIARLVAEPGLRVQGLVVPNGANGDAPDGAKGHAPTGGPAAAPQSGTAVTPPAKGRP